jgi:hypothetical protein
MPTTAISRATLLDQGLSSPLLLTNTSVASTLVSSATIVTSAATSGVAPVMLDSDILGSYKSLLSDNAFAILDPGLISVIGTAKTPLELATYFINGKYGDLGGASGMLGSTTTAVIATAGGAGFVRQFQNGAIYWHPLVGAHGLHGPILVRWKALGADKGFLGFPTTDITFGADVNAQGLFAHFQGGSIYWAPLPVITGVASSGVLTNTLAAAALAPGVTTSPTISAKASATAASVRNSASIVASAGRNVSATGTVHVSIAPTGAASGGSNAKMPVTSVRTGVVANTGIIGPLLESSAGAFEVHGAIRDKYLALGAEASILGYPRTDETGTPDGIGRYNHFQGGSIYWTPGTWAHEVHGLIRDRWSALGWETNPQLGYPISDEMIPDPRIGHRRPETFKKPIASLPIDVVKLPAEAAVGFPSAVVNSAEVTATPLAAPPAPIAASSTIPARNVKGVAEMTSGARVTTNTVAAKSSAVSATASRDTSVLGKLSDKATATNVATGAEFSSAGTVSVTQPNIPIVGVIDPGLLGTIILGDGPASTAGPRSVNRFGDFESGVLFWTRGATAAVTLSPSKSTSDGTSLAFAGADVATAVVTKMGRATFETTNIALSSLTFVGTTPYSFDGSQTHNRRHRLHLILHGTETPTIIGLPLPPINVTATIELQVEAWFDASQRRIAITPTDWSMLAASTSTYAASVMTAMHAKLDVVLWSSYELMTLPDTDGGSAIAVLSVKTLANGAVAVFVEPHPSILLLTTNEFANSVAPSVLVFSQPA